MTFRRTARIPRGDAGRSWSDFAVCVVSDNVRFLSFLVGPVAGRSAGGAARSYRRNRMLKAGRNHAMSTRTHGRAVGPGGANRVLLTVPVLAGVGYAVAWVASQSVGAPSPSIAASGTQLVTSFAGHGGPNMVMFVLAEGVAAVFLTVIAYCVTRPTLHRDPPASRGRGRRPSWVSASGWPRRRSRGSSLAWALG